MRSLAIGHPFFAPRAGRDLIGVLLNARTDWVEIRGLVTESYRLPAKKLTALDQDTGGRDGTTLMSPPGLYLGDEAAPNMVDGDTNPRRRSWRGPLNDRPDS